MRECVYFGLHIHLFNINWDSPFSWIYISGILEHVGKHATTQFYRFVATLAIKLLLLDYFQRLVSHFEYAAIHVLTPFFFHFELKTFF